MKKIILLVFSLGFLNASLANDLSDWTTEDLCRWVDYALETPTYNEYGTVFPSPKVKDKKKSSGLRFIFNYKITL